MDFLRQRRDREQLVEVGGELRERLIKRRPRQVVRSVFLQRSRRVQDDDRAELRDEEGVGCVCCQLWGEIGQLYSLAGRRIGRCFADGTKSMNLRTGLFVDFESRFQCSDTKTLICSSSTAQLPSSCCVGSKVKGAW